MMGSAAYAVHAARDLASARRPCGRRDPMLRRRRCNCVRFPCSETTSATSHKPGRLPAPRPPRVRKARSRAIIERRAPSAERRAPSAELSLRPHRRPHPDRPHTSGRGDAEGRDRHGRRALAPHRNRGYRSRSVAALARRAAGAFLLATFALLAFAPPAQADHNPAPPQNLRTDTVTANTIEFRWDAPSNTANVNHYRRQTKVGSGNFGTTVFSTTGARNYTRFGLQPATLVTTRVSSCFAQNEDHCSDWVELSASTLGPPGKVLNLGVARGTGDEFTLT